MINLVSNTAVGYAIVASVVLLAVIVYTVIRLKKQVKDIEKKEKDNKQ